MNASEVARDPTADKGGGGGGGGEGGVQGGQVWLWLSVLAVGDAWDSQGLAPSASSSMRMVSRLTLLISLCEAICMHPARALDALNTQVAVQGWGGGDWRGGKGRGGEVRGGRGEVGDNTGRVHTLMYTVPWKCTRQ